MSQSTRHSRRKLFQYGLAGLAIPPLESFIRTPSIAQAARPAKPPARLVTIFFPNGVSLPPKGHASFQDWHWFPHTSGSDYVFTKTLQPLEQSRKDLSILSGLSHPSLRTNITHSCSAQFLTGVDQSNGYRNSISYDQVFAEEIDGATRFSSLAFSTNGGTGSLGRPATLSVNRDGALIPSMSKPQEIFDRLFVVDSRSAEARARKLARDRSILDRVSSRITNLNAVIGSADRARLDSYLTATRTLEKQLGRANEWLNVPKPEVDPGQFDFNAEPTRELGTNYVRTMFDLIHMALLTDSTRVITYQMAMENAGGRGNKLPYAAGLSLHHHQLSHSAARDKDGWERWAKYDQYLAERLAEFLTKMAETPDPLADGSLLDNTIVLYGCGTSRTHIGRNYPIVLAGGKNLGLHHGAYHRFEEERPFNDLLLTLLQRVGVETDSFGDSEGTVDQILV